MFANPSARKRILDGNLLFGCFINTAAPFSTMIAAQVGFDVVLLDHEHGPGDFHDARHCMDAAMGTGAEVWVRVPANEQAYLKRILDCGADGIMCPLVNTADEAREILRKLVGEIPEWTALDSYIVAYVATPQQRRTAIASAFAASLELVREKVVEIRQDTHFATLYMRDVTRPGAEQ